MSFEGMDYVYSRSTSMSVFTACTVSLAQLASDWTVCRVSLLDADPALNGFPLPGLKMQCCAYSVVQSKIKWYTLQLLNKVKSNLIYHSYICQVRYFEYIMSKSKMNAIWNTLQ